MEISAALDNAHTIEEAAELITEATAFNNSEDLAAQYAWSACEGSGYAITMDAIETHLDFIMSAGAEFNYAEAALLCELSINRGEHEDD